MNRLLYLRGLGILGVVMYHASGWGFIAMFWWTNRYLPVDVPNFDRLGSISYYALRMVEQLIIFVVPAFLFVSGYATTKSFEKNPESIRWRKIFSRIRRVLIPFLVWSLVIIGLEMALGNRYTIPELLSTVITGRVTEAYYFIPVLIQLYLLIPFIVPIAKSRWLLVLIVSALLMVWTYVLHYINILSPEITQTSPLLQPIPGWLFIGHGFWFCLGIVIAFYHTKLQASFERIKWSLVSMLALTYFIGIIEWEYLLQNSGRDWIGPRMTLVDAVYIILFLLTFLAFEKSTLPLTAQFNGLGGRSYGIYLVHSIVLFIATKLVYRFVPEILGYQIIYQPLLVAVGIAIPVILMEFVFRSRLKPFYEVLFGRR